MSENTVDEVVSTRNSNGASVARPTMNETVEASTGTTTVQSNAQEDSVREGGGRARVFKESTQKLMEALDHEQGDAVPGEEDEPAETGDPAPEGEEAAVEKDEQEEGDDLRAAAGRLEETNRALVAELEAARKTPLRDRTEREVALVDAERAYVDEGSVPALRKFLATVIGHAPDSKEVDAELSGLYADLTARELNVPLDQSQKALREAAQARLALARDKRERAESEKKAASANSGGAQQIEQASKYIDNLLVAKGSNTQSLADEFPMLMTLSEHFDGVKPGELLARAIQREFQVGTLDPKTNEYDAVRKVARQIEAHYKKGSEKISTALKPKTDTTNSGNPKKPAVANATSQEQRQKPGARTITNATASVAPGTKPKAKQEATTTTEKTRKDFKTDAAWRQHVLHKHFPG